jgi:hypothetical protein
VGEDDKTVFGYVFVQQDATLGIAQQARQCRFAVQERQIAQILAIMLDKVEGVEACAPVRISNANCLCELYHTLHVGGRCTLISKLPKGVPKSPGSSQAAVPHEEMTVSSGNRSEHKCLGRSFACKNAA